MSSKFEVITISRIGNGFLANVVGAPLKDAIYGQSAFSTAEAFEEAHGVDLNQYSCELESGVLTFRAPGSEDYDPSKLDHHTPMTEANIHHGN